MSLSLCNLASGSGGNCTVIRTQVGLILIDCGIGPRTAAARMKGSGAIPADITAICLTHLDRDHFNSHWIGPVIRRQIRIFCHESRVDHLRRIAGDSRFDALLCPFNGRAFDVASGISVSAIPLAHDADGSHGFVIDSTDGRVGYATDLGHVTDALVEQFDGCDVIGLESNYDPHMQRDSGRPIFLQRRIMGGRGHLSNHQAFDAIRRILNRCRRLPRHIVLLHRSRQCNCPNLLRELFSRDPRIAARLVLAEQHCRTEWLTTRPVELFAGEQLELAFG